MADVEEPAVSDGNDAAQRHLRDDLRALVDSGLTLAKAELALQKAKAAYAANSAKGIVFLGLFAFVFVFFALMALTLGAVLSLATLIGPPAATLVVFAVLAAIATGLALVAAGRWKRMMAVLTDEKAS